MKEKIAQLVGEIKDKADEMCRVLSGLDDDIAKVTTDQGNSRANSRISNALLNQSVKMKALAKKIYAVRSEVIAHGKGKKEVRKASGGPKPIPPKPLQKKATTPPPPPPKA